MGDSGMHGEKPYIVMELLGPPISHLFKRLKKESLNVRWQTLRIIGRMLVRRLQAIHRCGFVHCDLQPGNILLGTHDAGGYAGWFAQPPFLVDFGCARSFPGGEPMMQDWGSVDFNSIRSLNSCCQRGPCDDLESLGWVLCHGLFGDLPWFHWTEEAQWSGGDTGKVPRAKACQEVRREKAMLLAKGCTFFG